jgi:hypothetical protein
MATPADVRVTGPGLTTILLITALVLTALGGGLLLAPRVMASIYGAATSADGVSAGRTAGAAILALGILSWFGARRRDAVGRVMVVRVLFVWFALKSVVAYWAVMDRVFNPIVGRSVLFPDVALAAVYGYFVFRSEFTERAEARRV